MLRHSKPGGTIPPGVHGSKWAGNPLTKSASLAGNHKVLSGQVNPLTKQPVTGAPVEVELRIARNGTKFNIFEMPDS